VIAKGGMKFHPKGGGRTAPACQPANGREVPMPVERFALQAPRVPRKDSACLGCADCTGLCWSLLELSRLPDWVLHPRNPSA
jgi:hypothetical protein